MNSFQQFQRDFYDSPYSEDALVKPHDIRRLKLDDFDGRMLNNNQEKLKTYIDERI